jgi:predicted secreted protein
MAAIRGTSGQLEFSAALAEVTSFTLDKTMDTIETSAMGDEMRSYVQGLGSFTISADIIVEATDAATQYTDIAELQFGDGSTSPVTTFTLYPEGNSTGAMKMTGACIITGFSMTSSFDGVVTGSITAQGTGAITYTPVA